jgi:MtN3 and saliva related transmembrane protein
MDNYDWIGMLAGVLTTLALLPQVVKVVREKDTRAISLGMYTIYTVGVALWFVYGMVLHSWPMIIANSLTLVLAIIILIMKLRLG